MEKETLVIGGGAIGLYLASKLKGTTILDQREKIGKPVRCTGILTKEAEKVLSVKTLQRISLNTIHSARIIGPTKEAKLKIASNYIIDNSAFEEELANRAVKNEGEIKTQHKYLWTSEKGHHVKNLKTGKEKIFLQKKIVGVDGPHSQVNKAFAINKKSKNYFGIQVRMKVKEQVNEIKFYPHIGVYAWYVPEGKNIARIGVCVKAGDKPQELLATFLKRFKGRVIETQAGHIPYYKPRHKHTGQIGMFEASLLGDAGRHIKNTTGGGLVPGMKAAKHFAETGNTRNIKLKRELYSHFLVHNLLKTANHKDWDKIIMTAQKSARVFEQTNRDNVLGLISKVAMNKTLLTYGLKKILSGKVRII